MRRESRGFGVQQRCEAIARKQFFLYAVSLIAMVVAVLVGVAAVQGVLGQWRLVVAALLAAVAGAS